MSTSHLVASELLPNNLSISQTAAQAGIMSHYKSASGRTISLLQDTNEMPTRQSQPPCSRQYSNYSEHTQSSYPNTPDLERSDSYDSQASGHESPVTPSNSAYPDPLFLNAMQPEHIAPASRIGAKGFSAQMYSGEVHTTLPPISSLHRVAGTMEPTSPGLTRRRSSHPYGAMPGGPLPSTDLEDFHYSYSKPSPMQPEPTLHHSIEHSDDGTYPEQPIAGVFHQASSRQSRNEDEKAPAATTTTTTRKASKAKDGSQKRYPCKDPSCDRTFTTSGHASRHAKIHEGNKPISCTFAGCPKRFTRQDNMKQHLETHRREKTRSTGSARATRRDRPSLAQRRHSMASSRGSVSRFSTPRDSPPLMSPGLPSAASMSPGLSPMEAWTRPNLASRTPSGLDTLAMVAATEQSSAEPQGAPRHFQYWPQHSQLPLRF